MSILSTLSPRRIALHSVAMLVLLGLLLSLPLLQAAPGQPDMSTTRNPQDAFRHASIEDLLRNDGPNTTVLLHAIVEGQPSPERALRMASAAQLLQFAQAHGARVLVVSHMSQQTGKVPAANFLPRQLRQVLLPGTVIANVALMPIGVSQRAVRVLREEMQNSGNTTVANHYLAGRRNLLIIGEGEMETVVPTFEGAWLGFNVYRNPLLDVTHRTPNGEMNHFWKFARRMDDSAFLGHVDPLALPGFLAEDPFLHYVPVGAIPGVVDHWIPAANEPMYVFQTDGVPFPHVGGDPAVPARGFFGDMADVNQFDLRFHLRLADNFDNAILHYNVNPGRSALGSIEQNFLDAFAHQTRGVTEPAALAAEFHRLALGNDARNLALPNPSQQLSQYRFGVVEVTVYGHGGGGLDGQHPYTVAGLAPAQLGAVIAEHPTLGLADAVPTAVKTIAHLNLVACGVRCRPDYAPNTGPDLSASELEYAQQVVRWLRARSVDVERVTIANVSLVLVPNDPSQQSTYWFLVSDENHHTQFMVRESKLLSTTLAYDSASDVFTEDPEYVASRQVAATTQAPLAPSQPGDIDTVLAGASVPDGAAAPSNAHITAGVASRTASGATIDVDWLGDVQPRLDNVREGASHVLHVAKNVQQAPRPEDDAMIAPADPWAVVMGMRAQGGPVVVVDTDPARLAGLERALQIAEDSQNPREWVQRMRAGGMAGAETIVDWMSEQAQFDWQANEHGMLGDIENLRAFERLQNRIARGHYTFIGADLATREGGAIVNAAVNGYPVRSMVVASDYVHLVQGARLDVRQQKSAYLRQLRENVALIAEASTVVYMDDPAGARIFAGDQAVRDYHQLGNAQPPATPATPTTPPADIDGTHVDDALVNAARDEVAAHPDAAPIIDDIDAGLADRSPLHRWWAGLRDRFAALNDWVRVHLQQLLHRLGVAERGQRAITAAEIAAREDDPVRQRIGGEHLARRLIAASREAMRNANLHVNDWLPVLATARQVTGDATPCTLSTCTAPAEREYEVEFMHEGTGETRRVTTRDGVFVETREFVDAVHAEATANASRAPASGGHVTTMNTAFALMGLMHALEGERELTEGLPENLATALQVQMYVAKAQIVLGVVQDGLQLAQIVREGMMVARQIEVTAGETGLLVTRVLSMAERTLGPAAMLLNGAMVGLDIYNLANAQTDSQRAVFGTQLAFDSSFTALMTTAFIAEALGAAEASAVFGAVAAPLAGLGIGIVGLVQTFTHIAEEIDATAAKFDKFADLYPRPSWTTPEDNAPIGQQTESRPTYTWDADKKTLMPVHGIATNRVDLRTRHLGSAKLRKTATAESYIQPLDISKLGTPPFGGQSYLEDNLRTLHASTVPQPNDAAAGIPILARSGIYNTGTLPIADADKVETLVLPATPASHFTGWQASNIPGANIRHLHLTGSGYEPQQGFMGYAVLRKLESNQWATQAPFVFDFDMNTIEYALSGIREDFLSTTVDVVLDEHVQTLALPAFTLPKNNDWTKAQQDEYLAANATMSRQMQYRVSPGGRREPVAIVLQNNYGQFELQAPASGMHPAVWLLDARHLKNPDAASVSVARRTGEASDTSEHGVLAIDGQVVRIAGVTGAQAKAGEGKASVFVVLPHGVWRVDFEKREMESFDLLAVTDLVHGHDVRAALARSGFHFRADSFIEITAPANDKHPVNGAMVTRYYESTRDASVVHAIDDAYPDARLVFGDALEALFHDPKTGRLHRVRRGDVLPEETFQVGTSPANATTIQPHSISRVQRVDGATLLVLASFAQRVPAYMDGSAGNRVDDGSPTLLVSYRLTRHDMQIVGISDHDALSAWLEEADRATPNNVTWTNFPAYLATLTDGTQVARVVANQLTPQVPSAAEWISVHGRIKVDNVAVSRPYWIRARDGHLLKPLWVQPSATCVAGAGAVDGFKVRQAVTSAGCTVAHPDDPVWLGTYQEGGTEWFRFHVPSLKGVFGVRAYDTGRTPVQYPRTQLLSVGDAATQSASGPSGEDASGLVWTYDGLGGQRLSRVGAKWITARTTDWHSALRTLVQAQPDAGALPVLPVDGLQDRDGKPIAAWFLPAHQQWAFGPAGARGIGDLGRTSSGASRIALQDADGTVFEVSSVSATTEVARLFDKLRMRLALQTRPLATGLTGTGKVVAATVREDAACRGVQATYDSGAVVCLASGTQPRVVEWRACGTEVPPASAFKGIDADYVALTCAATTGATPTPNGWRAPDGTRIAPPKSAAVLNAEHRVLGFNTKKREAYYYVPQTELLHVTDWAGNQRRLTWLADAQLADDALYVKMPAPGVAVGVIPLIDGIDVLGIGHDSQREARYRIGAAERAHYTRILVDMGDTPVGTWLRHVLELGYADASRLEPQRTAGGWLLVDDETGRGLELRGRGGHKRVVFLDTNKSLDLATLRPMSFFVLPEGYAAPANDAVFSDRQDIDGDGIADLVKLVENGTQRHLEWAFRNVDGTLDPGPARRSTTPVSAFDARWHRGFYTVEGIVHYCGVTPRSTHPQDVELGCHRIDADGVQARRHRANFNATWGGAAPAMGADITPMVRDLVVRSAFWEMPEAGRHVRFNGSTMECLGNGTCTNAAELGNLSLHPLMVALPQECQAGSPPAWCTSGLAVQDAKHVQGPWVTEPGPHPWVYRISEGEVECASYNGRNCLGGSVAASALDPSRLQPLRCGAPHQIQWGSFGYGQSNHWCERLRPGKSAATGTPGSAPTVSNLRITGTLRVGETLRGEYDFHDADGDREGETLYQWYVSDPVTGAPVLVNNARDRTYTLRGEDRGTRKVWFNIERLRSATGTPRDALNMPIGASRTGTIDGRLPTASNVRMTGTFKIGHTITAAFDYHHPDGDVQGTHEYRWYRAPAATPAARTLIATTTVATYVLRTADGDHVMSVEVVPVSKHAGVPTTGAAVSSPSSVAVDSTVQHYANTTDLPIPDNETVESKIVVNDEGTIEKLTVDLRLMHTYQGDLQVDLITPYGKTLNLHNRTGNGVDNLIRDYVFTIDATGYSQRGVWTLRIRDQASADTGHLDQRGLKFR